MSRPATLVKVQRALLDAGDWTSAIVISRRVGVSRDAAERALLSLLRRGQAQHREVDDHSRLGAWRAPP